VASRVTDHPYRWIIKVRSTKGELVVTVPTPSEGTGSSRTHSTDPASISEDGVLSRVWLNDETQAPILGSAAVDRLADVLQAEAAGFARNCREHPAHVLDGDRAARLLCAAGIGRDEARGFTRALDHGLVELDGKGGFIVPGARACSPNLHLVGRETDHVKLHNEVLIHVAAYAELVLDHGWAQDRLVFDPFMNGAALDLWGYAEKPNGPWNEGRIVFAAEAKSRVKGGDGLNALVRAFETLEADPDARVGAGHLRKWNELAALTKATTGSIELLLVANEARWWFDARWVDDGLQLTRRDT